MVLNVAHVVRPTALKLTTLFHEAKEAPRWSRIFKYYALTAIVEKEQKFHKIIPSKEFLLGT
jgi:hypothetical protein